MSRMTRLHDSILIRIGPRHCMRIASGYSAFQHIPALSRSTQGETLWVGHCPILCNPRPGRARPPETIHMYKYIDIVSSSTTVVVLQYYYCTVQEYCRVQHYRSTIPVVLYCTKIKDIDCTKIRSTVAPCTVHTLL